MNTYRSVADYLLHIIGYEGKTDAQNHIGKVCLYPTNVKTYFGGSIKVKDGHFSKVYPTTFFYAYGSKDDMDYINIALDYLVDIDYIVVSNGEDGFVKLWAIQ